MTNCSAVSIQDVPVLEFTKFREEIINSGLRIVSLFGNPTDGKLRLYCVLGKDSDGTLSILSADVGNSFRSITTDFPQAHMFEREIAEQWKVTPEGHPWLKPVRFPNDTNFFSMKGDEVHEVAVGPVHAGVIEPGHFRFQCHGEKVYHLEIELGYQHRGVERALVGGPSKRTIHLMETLAGDTTIGHSIAYAQVMEALTNWTVSPRANAIRAIALELERLANHTGDLGALANDVAFLPTASYCGRLRGDFLNMTALICGSRFGRGIVRPGGVNFDVDENKILSRLDSVEKDLTDSVNLLWDTPSVVSRFEETGIVSKETCRQLGLVGVAARSCGVSMDVRRDYPFGIYMFSQIPVSTWQTGDVFARAYVRWLEIQRSLAFVREQLSSLPKTELKTSCGKLPPNMIAVSMTEGWRGEICHVAITDSDGKFSRYKIVDPSFHNWTGLAMALRDQQISDFPLCNKSFNLSYCGFDL